MTATQIISLFELLVDDSTELSTTEELALLNRVYLSVASDRAWKILQKEASGTMASTTTITLPSDFEFFVENYNYTDNSFSSQINQKPCVVFLNANTPYYIVNWADRRQYTNSNGVCWLDLANSVIKFPYTQSSGVTYSFDYKYTPAELTAGTSPVFPARFHEMLAYAMAVDDAFIQQYPKNSSYAPENMSKFQDKLTSMRYWDSNLNMN